MRKRTNSTLDKKAEIFNLIQPFIKRYILLSSELSSSSKKLVSDDIRESTRYIFYLLDISIQDTHQHHDHFTDLKVICKKARNKCLKLIRVVHKDKEYALQGSTVSNILLTMETSPELVDNIRRDLNDVLKFLDELPIKLTNSTQSIDPRKKHNFSSLTFLVLFAAFVVSSAVTCLIINKSLSLAYNLYSMATGCCKFRRRRVITGDQRLLSNIPFVRGIPGPNLRHGEGLPSPFEESPPHTPRPKYY